VFGQSASTEHRERTLARHTAHRLRLSLALHSRWSSSSSKRL